MSYRNNTSWLEEYEELMFGPSHSEQTMSQAADIKYQYMPNMFFKYRSCSKNAFEALEQDFLFSSQPSKFNDIFEGAIEIVSEKAERNFHQEVYNSMKSTNRFLVDRPTHSYHDLLENIAISFGGSYQDIKQNHPLFPLMETRGIEAKRRFDDTIRSIQNNARNMYNICCFCATNDSETMWAYYADSHEGFCIGYDIKSLNNNLTHLTFPVLYKDHCTLQIDDIDHVDGSVCMHMLTEKSLAWRHEKEWRTFFPPNPPNHKESMPTAKAVYLGARILPKNEERLKEICNRKQIRIYKMVPIISEYKLIALPL